jgi:hypothetical protein
MTDDELSRHLTQALGGKDAPPVDPAHRARLEGELLAAYERRMVASPVRPAARPVWVRYAPAFAVLLCLVTATRVPAGYKVEVGKRITLVLAPGTPLPERLGGEVAEALRAPGARVMDVRVRQLRHGGAPDVLRVDVWGDALADDAEAEARLRALPGLAGVQVQLERLEGRVHDNLLGALRHRLFRSDASPAERAEARVRLIEELRRVEGNDVNVEVDVDEGGRTRVRLKKQRRVQE